MNSYDATIVDVREESRSATVTRWQLLLDRLLHVAGEPLRLQASSRNGTLLLVNVLEVKPNDAGEVWLVVDKPLSAGTCVRVIPLG